MIDKVKLTRYQKYDDKLFENNNFRYKISKRTKLKYYYKTINSVSVLYFIEKSMLMISGRIIYLYKDTIGKVKNFDDVMITEKISFDYIQRIVEKNLMKLFFPNQEIVPIINLDEFNLNFVEYCVNIDVKVQPKVEAYIKMFNLIFIDKADPRYINYVVEAGKKLHTSSYIKSKKKYEENSKVACTINYYNKLDQLSSQNINRWTSRSKKIHKKSLEESEGILRLEVKFGSQALYQLRKNDDLSRLFIDYKSIDFAYSQIINKYSWFYGKGDFYSYQEIKKIICESNMSQRVQKNVLSKYADYSKKISQELKLLKKVNHSLSNQYKSKMKALGVNPVLIPTRFKVSKLECPIKLLDSKKRKLESIRIT